MKTDPPMVQPASAAVQPPEQLKDPDLRPEDRVTFNEDWRRRADLALEALASSGVPFTTHDLRDSDRFGLEEPPHPNHWGAVVSSAKARGLIRPVGYVCSATPSRHHSVVRQWRGRPERFEQLPGGTEGACAR